MLRDFLIGALATPLSDPEVTRILANRKLDELFRSLEAWLKGVRHGNSRFQFEVDSSGCRGGWLSLLVRSPHAGKVCFRLVQQEELLRESIRVCVSARQHCVSLAFDILVLVFCVDETNPNVRYEVDACWQNCEQAGATVILMEPAWAGAVLVEQMLPILTPLSFIGSSPVSYFDTGDSTIGKSVSIRRVRSSLQTLLGAVLDDPGNFAQKWRQQQQEVPAESEIFLCSTFLPPVNHCRSAVERFYRAYGATEETCRLVLEKADWEKKTWYEHIAKRQRIDIIDRHVLEEYLAAPEYYQMPLTKSELAEQIDNIAELLQHANYSMCLTPEAVDMSYEIRDSEVRIRADRRNKGQPRVGRISGLVLNDPRMLETFEREFWTMFRLTEPQFKDKKYVLQWLKEHSQELYGRSTSNLATSESFDVFLCHNNADKSEIRKIAKRLKKEGITVWLDEMNLIPGRPWQRALEAQISKIKSAAVFVGMNSVGPWTNMELDGFMREFVRRSCPVIPVILPSATGTPDLPVFLKGMHWVDFRRKYPNPWSELLRGIRSAT